jgi:hypothetical protein
MDKHAAFATALAARAEAALRGQCYWDWNGKRMPGDLKIPDCFDTECDYDPSGPLLEAVHEVIAPACGDWRTSTAAVLPKKHLLTVHTDAWILKPKEGYGNWTEDIPVPAPTAL